MGVVVRGHGWLCCVEWVSVWVCERGAILSSAPMSKYISLAMQHFSGGFLPFSGWQGSWLLACAGGELNSVPRSGSPALKLCATAACWVYCRVVG